MRKPSLTFDTFVAALVVATATAGCSKAERASAAPDLAPPAASPAADPTPAAPPAEVAAPPAENGAPAAPAPAAPPPVASAGDPTRAGKGLTPSKSAVTATPVDAGSGAAKRKADPMSCGAGGCTADMKKGN